MIQRKIMTKYLFLNFRNAKLFKSKRTKDKAFNLGISQDRKDMSIFKEPITVYQVSNLLHVMFGERPVPSMRTCFYDKVDYYFEKAKESYIKIDTPKFATDKLKTTFVYPYEIIQTKKSVWNSFNKQKDVNWKLVETYVGGVSPLHTIKQKLNQVLKVNVDDYIFMDVIEMVQKLTTNVRLDLYNTINSLGNNAGLCRCFGVYDVNKKLFETPNVLGITNNYARTALTVVNGIEPNTTVLNGSIIVPVTDEDIERLKNTFTGTTTILDGGLVWLEHITHDFNPDDYTKMSEISTEKI
jgi:hypothetical protein